MFDRLYRVIIHHSALTNGVLDITGDSAKSSLDIDFAVSTNQSYVSINGSLTIRGLTTEHINLLSAIKRYDIAKNAETKNTVTLAIGWRDAVTGAESKRTVVMHGTIIEATPGPLPERSLTMQVMTSSLSTAIPDDNQVIFAPPEEVITNAQDGVNIEDWLTSAAGNIVSKYYKVIVEKDGWESFPKIENEAYPTTLKEFKDSATNKGAEINEVLVQKTLKDEDTLSSDDVPMIAHVYVYAERIPCSLVRLVSQETGMIGIPRSIKMGAEVDVVLKDIIPPGSFVNLQTTKFPNLSSNPDLYTDGGIYQVMGTRLQGQFRGDVWKQTLTLLRGSTRIEVKG